MDPGSQQADCLSSTSSDSEDSPTTVPQITMPFAQVQADGKQDVSPPSSDGSRRGSEDGVLGSPITETYGDSDCEAGPQSSTAEYEQESFETYQHNVSQLCHDIGYGELSKIERMKGGSYNRIIGLEFATPEVTKYVLRIPRNGIEFDVAEDIKDQVATLSYVSQFLPVPFIAAFDSTQKNALASAYVLQQRVPGTVMEKVFYNLPLAGKLQLTTKIAELMIKMDSIKLDTPGRVVASDDVPDLQHQQMSSLEPVKIAGFRSARYASSAKFPAIGNAPFTSLMQTIFDERKQLCITRNEPWMVEKMEMLQKIVSQMEEVGLVRVKDNQCFLWHWDFAARNIMISQASTTDVSQVPVNQESEEDLEPLEKTVTSTDSWFITGVLDWDGIMSVPLVLARQPPLWLWCNEDERSSAWSGNLDVPPTRVLTQDELTIKGHFDQIMARADPSYIEDAYIRGPWLRRLARFALFGFSEFGCFERYDALVKDWEKHFRSIAGSGYESSDSVKGYGSGEEDDYVSDDDREEAENIAIDSEHEDDSDGDGESIRP
jgi:hypothetical protein